MDHYLIKGETLSDIADAIREKTGNDSPIATEDMAGEIENIPQGGTDPEKGVVFSEYDENGFPTQARIIGYEVPPQYLLKPAATNSAYVGFLSKLETIIFDNVTAAPPYLAQGNSNLKKVYLSDNTTKIHSQAFRSTDGLIELSIGASKIDSWDCYYNGSTMGSTDGISFIFRNPIESITVIDEIYHGGFGSTKAILYDFSNNGDVVTSITTAAIGHKDGCIIRVPAAKLSEWQAATNWCSLPTDPNESGYVVWQGV